MLFLDLVLSVFRLNGLLVAEGDAMTEDLGLTSARWKVIGVVALSTAGLTVPGIARVLGQSRQAVQRITDVMAQDGLITYEPNPKHKRSVLVLLTDEGKSAYHALREVQDPLGYSQYLKTYPSKNSRLLCGLFAASSSASTNR
jgi:DNA-binding MarR family transcriptional regulator